jgi:hypothetical protein
MKMKKFLLLLGTLLYVLNFSLAMAEDAPLIAERKKAVSFGIWRIYNTGDDIFIIDEKDRRFIHAEWTTNEYQFNIKNQGLLLGRRGTIPDLLVLSPNTSTIKNREEGLEAKISGHLKDGLYSFGAKRFEVKGETLALFFNGQAGLSSDTVPLTILKKFSNGLVHHGTSLSNTIDPSVVIDVNDVPGPAVVVGDCLATYSPETGRVEIPCLSIKGNNTIYHVGQQKLPDSSTFEVNDNDIIRVQ